MDFANILDGIEDIVWRVKEFLSGGRWVWILAIAGFVLVVALPLSLLWPTIRPKPEPQYQRIPANAGQVQQVAAPLPTVPKEVTDEIAGKLGVKNLAALRMRYEGDENHVRATQSLGGTKFKTYMFVRRESGSWARQ